ncbi:hypothetical protein LTR05_000629 [Lithohypha guttulata]|uniref:Uncharacterized protein n=1 Tax=Lithohypha guttulata TaxID=1690604 RepID=A0AAN7T680_9EURO|nr:hypothetical protein LTR05_000629 [Lithohypha guttulata]
MPQELNRDQAEEKDSRNGLQNPQRMATEMAKAFQELAKGEQTASALEKQLDGIEGRIDELLAAAEEAEREANQRMKDRDTEKEPS